MPVTCSHYKKPNNRENGSQGSFQAGNRPSNLIIHVSRVASDDAPLRSVGPLARKQKVDQCGNISNVYVAIQVAVGCQQVDVGSIIAQQIVD